MTSPRATSVSNTGELTMKVTVKEVKNCACAL